MAGISGGTPLGQHEGATSKVLPRTARERSRAADTSVAAAATAEPAVSRESAASRGLAASVESSTAAAAAVVPSRAGSGTAAATRATSTRGRQPRASASTRTRAAPPLTAAQKLAAVEGILFEADQRVAVAATAKSARPATARHRQQAQRGGHGRASPAGAVAPQGSRAGTQGGNDAAAGIVATAKAPTRSKPASIRQPTIKNSRLSESVRWEASRTMQLRPAQIIATPTARQSRKAVAQHSLNAPDDIMKITAEGEEESVTELNPDLRYVYTSQSPMRVQAYEHLSPELHLSSTL